MIVSAYRYKYLPVPRGTHVPPEGLPIRRERDQPDIGRVRPTSKMTMVEIDMNEHEQLPDYIQFLDTWCRADWQWDNRWRDTRD